MRDMLSRISSHANVEAHLRALRAKLTEEAQAALAPLFERLISSGCELTPNGSELIIRASTQDGMALARALITTEGTYLADLFADRHDVGPLALHLLLGVEAPSMWVHVVMPAEPDVALASLVDVSPAMSWYERELWDEAGIVVSDHPYLRRLRLPAHWPEDAYPVRHGPDELLALTGSQAEPETAEARIPLVGIDDEREELDPGPEGVVDYPLGPVRSGVLESGHYLIRTVGEEIVDFRLQLFYKHRGIEQRALGLGHLHIPLVAERISGMSGFAHALAVCEALERAGGVEVPARARYLRTLFAELERIYNHLGYQADLCQATGLVVGQAQFDILKEQVLRLNGQLTGSRYLFGTCVFGGVAVDPSSEQLAQVRALVASLRRKVHHLGKMLFNSPSHVDRLDGTGILLPDDARAWCAVGPIGRASGQDRDTRRDHPYAAYAELAFDVPVLHEGDALARARVRLDETIQSLRLAEQVLDKLPSGPARVSSAEAPRDTSALGWVESPRGEGMHWLRLDTSGRIARYRVRTASFANAQTFPLSIPGRNILTDFPVIEQSWALSYAGADR